MKRNKKLCLLMSLVLSLTLFCGCNSSEGTTGSNDEENKQEEKKDRVVEEAVLLDNEAAKITLKSIEKGVLSTSDIKVEIENKFDKGITVQVRQLSINGIMKDPLFSSDVAVGKKAMEDISFMDVELDELVNIEGLFHVFTTEEWKDVGDYPFVALKDESIKPEAESKGEVLLDNEIAKVIYVGIDKDGLIGQGVELEIINKTDKTILVQTEGVSVDGYMSEPILSSEITSGKRALSTMTFTSDDISELKNIEGKFVVIDYENWDRLGEYDFTIK